jgi:hypothetical protein
MRGSMLGVAIMWILIALAIATRVSFSSFAANALAVFTAMTGSVFLMLALSQRIQRRNLAILYRVALSGIYLIALWFLGLGWVFYPWNKPDLEVSQHGLTCRAVYGYRTEVKVFRTYPLGLERLQDDYLVDGTPEPMRCDGG